MRKYELVCIFDPQVGENQFDGVVEKYESYLKANGAEVVQIDRWGMRQLAYTSPRLKTRRQGYYVLYQFMGEPTQIEAMEQELRLDEAVLRHLVVAIEGEFLRVPELAPESILDPPPRGRDRDRRGGRSDRDDRRRGQDSRDRRPREENKERADSADSADDADDAKGAADENDHSEEDDS